MHSHNGVAMFGSVPSGPERSRAVPSGPRAPQSLPESPRTARQASRFWPRRETKIHAKIHRRYSPKAQSVGVSPSAASEGPRPRTETSVSAGARRRGSRASLVGDSSGGTRAHAATSCSGPRAHGGAACRQACRRRRSLGRPSLLPKRVNFVAPWAGRKWHRLCVNAGGLDDEAARLPGGGAGRAAASSPRACRERRVKR